MGVVQRHLWGERGRGVMHRKDRVSGGRLGSEDRMVGRPVQRMDAGEAAWEWYNATFGGGGRGRGGVYRR